LIFVIIQTNILKGRTFCQPKLLVFDFQTLMSRVFACLNFLRNFACIIHEIGEYTFRIHQIMRIFTHTKKERKKKNFYAGRIKWILTHRDTYNVYKYILYKWIIQTTFHEEKRTLTTNINHKWMMKIWTIYQKVYAEIYMKQYNHTQIIHKNIKHWISFEQLTAKRRLTWVGKNFRTNFLKSTVNW
jgi:hypothetical protein